MDPKVSPNGDQEPNPLTAEEQAILDELQRLFAAGYQEVPQEFIDRIDRTIKWDLNDPAAVQRSLYFMARDPYYQREAKIISREFAAAETAEIKDRG